MSTYTIIVLSLTGLYMTYMLVVIALDLFGTKGKKKNDEEVFHTSDSASDSDDSGEEASTVVEESDDGYSMHSDSEDVEPLTVVTGEPAEEEDDEEPSVEESPSEEESPVDDDDDYALDEESEESLLDYQRAKSVQEQMQSCVPSYQDEYGSNAFAVLLSKPIRQSSKILINMVNM